MKLPSSSWRPGPSRDVVPLTRSRALCSARQPKLIATVVLWSCAWRPPSATMRKELLRADGAQSAAAALKGPILFYTGNESPIDEYVNNTGLMWSLAPKLGALLVFAEHRYEVTKRPFRDAPFCNKNDQFTKTGSEQT